MLPMITIALMISYLDRSNVTNARVAGMQKDMKMNDVEWASLLPLNQNMSLTRRVRVSRFSMPDT
jgi:hypothetical protein